jgi:hypothetical protein
MDGKEPVKKNTKRKQSKKMEIKYFVSDYMENPEVLETSSDMIKAAFRFNSINEATVNEAKRIVNEFSKKEV